MTGAPVLGAAWQAPLRRHWVRSRLRADGRPDPTSATPVSLPAANAELPFFDLRAEMYRFPALYRRELLLPPVPVGWRSFVTLDGILHVGRLRLNGELVATHAGGYTPWRVELTQLLRPGPNALEVEVDGTAPPDVPPLGRTVEADRCDIDFHTFGGITRPPRFAVVPPVFVSALRALPRGVTQGDPIFEVLVVLDPGPEVDFFAEEDLILTVGLRAPDGQLLARADAPVPVRRSSVTVELGPLDTESLWSPARPTMLQLTADLVQAGRVLQQWSTPVGLRQIDVDERHLYVNGEPVPVRGLNRHELFPGVGAAVADRVHARDAEILRHELGCTLVRTAHYPHSPAFLDACDRLGLLVFEEIPGWGHLGSDTFRERVLADVAAMVRRDWNHPSVALWGVRCNESPDDDVLYAATNALAHRLDDSRPTTGARNFRESAPLEDVFALNDYDERPGDIAHAPVLISELVGAITPADGRGHVYHRLGDPDELEAQGLRHARAHDALGRRGEDGRPVAIGGVGWVAFDYPSPCGPRWRETKTPGVYDLFRLPKPAAGFYASQVSPDERIVLLPGFVWDEARPRPPGRPAPVWSNCDLVEVYVGAVLLERVRPAREDFPHLAFPPFFVPLPAAGPAEVPEIRLVGHLGGREVITRLLVGDHSGDRLAVWADDETIAADGVDATRVVIAETDRVGNLRHRSGPAVDLAVEGPAVLVGPNPFPLGETGGAGAVWLRGIDARPGRVTVAARHPVYGRATVELTTLPVPDVEVPTERAAGGPDLA